jgi:tetratricopeptide (TPR) repeat protein
MERRQQMDIAGFASTRRQMKTDRIYRIVRDFFEPISVLNNPVNLVCSLGRAPAAVIFLILAFSALPLLAQPAPPDHATEIKQLLVEERWEEIVRVAEADAERSADLNYYYGTALARLGRWDEAKRAFQIGLSQQPGEKRFSHELAGVCFRKKNYAEAADHLRRALRLDPADTYANDFLAGVYFLQGNVEAALKYWKRVSKPEIEEVRIEPPPRVAPALLDRAFTIAPASALDLRDLQTTKARVRGLNIFSNYRFNLEARPDGKFDLVFRARERNVGPRWAWLLALLRGLPYQTVSPEFFNIRGRAINSESLIRWDAEKRRLWTNLSGPLFGDPKMRFQLDLDLRDENWDVGQTSVCPQPGQTEVCPTSSLNLNRQAFAASATSFVNGRLDWSTGFEISRRNFRDVDAGGVLTPGLLAQGFQLKHLGQLNYKLLEAPERRISVAGSASTQLGRIWSQQSRVFAKLQSSIETRWFPQSAGDDYEMRGKISAGQTFGESPFDELFILGVERDNDLWMRAHVGTRDGRKGSAPLGRDYVLSNWELDKNVYDNGLMRLKLGPFLDSGKITDSSSGLGSRTWLWDLGAQAKVQALGVGIVFSYGKDLRSGNNAFYLRFTRFLE